MTAALHSDLIAAVATPPGMGGVVIVRLSGPGAYDVARSLTHKDLQPRVARYCDFTDPDTGDLIDQGLVLWFAQGQSFTGEEVVELHAHGSPVVLKQLLDVCCAQGARIAQPGEFSERAFLNNRLDLAQAEAIADLIASGSQAAARAAARSLRGEFSARINNIAERLETLRVFVEAVIDFPEEEVEHLEQGAVAATIGELGQAIADLLASAQQGKLINDGVTVALIGPPNAGKSSLLNALSGEDNAIVTDVPGTTRDVLKVDLVLDGVPVRLADTAGLRHSDDLVEQIGMQRSRQQVSEADVVLLVLQVDAEAPADWTKWLHEQISSLDLGADWSMIAGQAVVVVNKTDLLDDAPEMHLPDADGARGAQGALYVASAVKFGRGVDKIKQALLAKVGKQSDEAPFTARARHLDALERAATDLHSAGLNLAAGYSAELIAEELRSAHLHMGEIVGVTTADDLLGRIFSEFCIGK